MRNLLPILLLAACDGEETATPTDASDLPLELEIIGSYVDDFDGTHEITADTWTMAIGGVFHIDSYDNAEKVLFAENDSANEYNPGLWSRMDWTWDGEDLYFCQTAYAAADRAAAEGTEAADAGDLEMGCGGWAWSALM